MSHKAIPSLNGKAHESYVCYAVVSEARGPIVTGDSAPDVDGVSSATDLTEECSCDEPVNMKASYSLTYVTACTEEAC